MNDWKYKYLLNYEGIYFKQDDVEECIKRIITEFRILSDEMRTERRFNYDASRIYLIDSIINYKVLENEINFSVDGENKAVRIVNCIEDEYDPKVYFEFQRGEILNKYVVSSFNVHCSFDLHRSIDEAIEFLVSKD